MPLYEYRCVDCDTVFEQRRPMAEADVDVRCPDGHTARRLLSVFASTRSGGAPSPAPMPSGGMGGGMGCGPACGCH